MLETCRPNLGISQTIKLLNMEEVARTPPQKVHNEADRTRSLVRPGVHLCSFCVFQFLRSDGPAQAQWDKGNLREREKKPRLNFVQYMGRKMARQSDWRNGLLEGIEASVG